MRNLLRMDTYRLVKSRTFWFLCGMIFVFTLASPILVTILMRVVNGNIDMNDPMLDQEAKDVFMSILGPQPLSGMISNHFGGVGLLPIVPLVSASAFMYGDQAHGYVKNLAGQIPGKGYLALSKFIVMAFHHLIMLVIGFFGTVLGNLFARGVTADDKIGEALGIFITRFFLLYALTAILLLFSSGLGKKTLAVVMSVVFATGALSAIYLPLDMLFDRVFHWDIKIEAYMPDALYLSGDLKVLDGLLVSLVFLAGFVTLAVWCTNRRDVK